MGSEFLRMKGILDQIPETEDETKLIVEVSLIKANLDHDGYKSEWVLCYLLKKLKQMVVSLKVLEKTMIGKSVSILQEHESKDIRQIARMLIRSWRRMVDKWVTEDNRNTSVSHAEQCSGSNINIEKQVMQTSKRQRVAPTNRNGDTSSGSVETTTKSRVGMSLEKKSVEERLESAKRKMREGYKEAENAKKLGRIQVIGMHDVLRLGLVPEQKERMFRNHIRPYVRLVR